VSWSKVASESLSLMVLRVRSASSAIRLSRLWRGCPWRVCLLAALRVAWAERSALATGSVAVGGDSSAKSSSAQVGPTGTFL